MKKIVFLLVIYCSFAFCVSASGQNSGRLVYLSKNKLNNYLEEEYLLSFKDNVSSFFLKKREVSDKISTNEFNDELTISNKYPDSLVPKYYLNVSKNEILFKKAISNDDFKSFVNYTVKDDLKLDWVIHNDTVSISNIKCQKASLNFRGREYTVWFSQEYKLPYGPFKFYGLPGIIVSIEDKLKEVSFFLKSINFIDINFDDEYNKIQNNKIITMKEFNLIQTKATQNSQDEFMRNMQSKLGRGATIKMVKTQNTNIELNFDDIN